MEAVSKSKGRPKTLDDGELVTADEVMADEALASGPNSRRRTPPAPIGLLISDLSELVEER